MWQQQSSVLAQPPSPAKSGSANDDSILSGPNERVYGVLGQPELAQPNEAAGGDNASLAPGSSPASLVDQVNHSNAVNADSPNHFLHRRLSVKTFEFFEFEVPSGAIRPELEGTFQSVATGGNPDGASVELLLMNDKEFARFVNHGPVVAKLSSPPSSGAEVYWKLNVPVGNPQKYYLVFRNSAAAQGPSIVDADFTASFE